MATVWNPADKTSSIALSLGNHKAAATVFANTGVRASPIFHNSGKWYFEYSSINFDGFVFYIGVASAAYTLGADMVVGSGGLGVDTGGNLHANSGSGNAALGSSPVGKVLSFAFDFDAHLVWVRYDAGSWFGDGTGTPADPAAGTHGGVIDSGLVGVSVTPAAHFQGEADFVTLNCGDSAFVNSVPAGFTAWDSTPPFTYRFGTVIR